MSRVPGRDPEAEERALFARRAALPAPPPPPFSQVLSRARKADPATARLARRAYPRLGLAAAAAIVGLYLARRPPANLHDGATPIIVAEPVADLVCADMPPTAALREADRSIAGVEDEYRACLLATPLMLPDGKSIEEVTCTKVEPRGDEACGEHACEGSDQ